MSWTSNIWPFLISWYFLKLCLCAYGYSQYVVISWNLWPHMHMESYCLQTFNKYKSHTPEGNVFGLLSLHFDDTHYRPPIQHILQSESCDSPYSHKWQLFLYFLIHICAVCMHMYNNTYFAGMLKRCFIKQNLVIIFNIGKSYNFHSQCSTVYLL